MRFLAFFCLILLLCGCASQADVNMTVPSPTTPAPTSATPTTPPETTPLQTTPVPTTPAPTAAPDAAQVLLDSMTVEEKVGQLFLARCDSAVALQDIEKYHLGGFVLFARDFAGHSPQTMKETLQAYQAAAKIPLLLAVDEEGGTVTRISTYKAFRESKFPSPRDAFAQGGMEGALKIEAEKARLLRSVGINVNLGPVCDVTQNPDAFMYRRSLGQDGQTTGQFVVGAVNIMGQYGVGSCLKHFPGYGENTDTHVGVAVDNRSLEALENLDLIPFQAGIDAGCGAIMVSHTYINAIDKMLPATLSPAVHGYLRDEMGFAGVIVTDDLVMQGITDRFGTKDAAVMAVMAGNDLLCSTEYPIQYEAVLDAVRAGRIPMTDLNAAVKRVLQWKMDLGLI